MIVCLEFFPRLNEIPVPIKFYEQKIMNFFFKVDFYFYQFLISETSSLK